MARTRTKPAVKQAQTLLDWLVTLDLPARVINALRRDLEAVMGQSEGSGILAGLDRAGFAEELYNAGGGRVGQVPSVAKAAIDALRAAIPAPVTDDSTDGVPADGAPESAAPAPEAVFQVEAAPETDAVDVAPVEATPAPVEPALITAEVSAAPAPRRGRGRPRKSEADPTPAPAEAPAVPARQRGRHQRAESTPVRPVQADVAEQRASPPPVTPAKAPPPAPAEPTVADPSFGAMLRLWRELHPQGQRAAMRYMADLLTSA